MASSHFLIAFKNGFQLSLFLRFIKSLCIEDIRMYAIIKSGGKQYRVKKDDLIDVELLEGQPGDTIEFSEILFVSEGSKVGLPIVSGFTVKGEFVDVIKGPKVTSVKYQPGNHYRKFGHRQKYARVKITAIEATKKGGHHGP